MAKFKDGDKVRCITNKGPEYSHSGYRFGDTYIVKSTYYGSRERIYTVKDSNGLADNGWGVENFELVKVRKPRAPKKPKDIIDIESQGFAHSFSPGGLPNKVLGTQVGGTHYTDCAIQPITYIWANKLGFSEGNMVKYITRWKSKGGIKDLKKTAHHCALLIEEAEAEEARTGIKYGFKS